MRRYTQAATGRRHENTLGWPGKSAHLATPLVLPRACVRASGRRVLVLRYRCGWIGVDYFPLLAALRPIVWLFVLVFTLPLGGLHLQAACARRRAHSQWGHTVLLLQIVRNLTSPPFPLPVRMPLYATDSDLYQAMVVKGGSGKADRCAKGGLFSMFPALWASFFINVILID